MSFEIKYDLHEELGKGMFGVVKKCRDKETGQVFAAKIIRKTTRTRTDAQREVETMKMLKHERLAQIYEAFETSRQIIIVMEFIPGQELFAKVTENDFLTERQAILYLNQILLGIQHMHKKYIVHLDIKPENIICKPGNGPGYEDVKLIDFGLAREILPGNSVSVLCGTPEFAAPEILSYDPVSTASDMWSIGVVTYILLSGISPFLGDNDTETIQYVTAGEYYFDEEFVKVTEPAKLFIEELLITDPKSRNTAEDCLQHQWITTGGGDTLLDTKKLKTFNAKRKWQKTINAVKAVGRFSFLNRVKKLKKNDDVIPLEKEDPVKTEVEVTGNNEYLHLPEIVSNDHKNPLPEAAKTSKEAPPSSELPLDEDLKSAETKSCDSSISTETTNNEAPEKNELDSEDNLKDAEFENTDNIPSAETFENVKCNEIVELNSNEKEEEEEEEENNEERAYNKMESNSRDEFSNHNGVDHHDDRMGTIKEDEVEKEPVKAAFKTWYRRASTSKQLTTMEQKALVESIPIVYEDEPEGENKPETNGHTERKQRGNSQTKEEQEILEAIGRRLSINPAKPPTITNGDNTPTKPKNSMRRGSVPQARMLKGNVASRLAAFEKK